MRNILFISHNASRSGAPIFLLNLLRWLKANTDWRMQIILRYSGELEHEFRQIGPAHIFSRYRNNLPAKVFRRLGLRIDPVMDRLKNRVCGNGVDLVYANTVMNGDVVSWLADRGRPVICHVHESEQAINRHLGSQGMAVLKQHVKRFIAVSRAVKDNLVGNHGIEPGEIDVVHGCIAVTEREREAVLRKRAETFKKLGIAPGTLVVGGCGALVPHKAPDLFVQLAGAVRRANPALPVHFVWVGGNPAGELYQGLERDAGDLGIRDRLHFTGATPDALEYFAAFDVFALTSREDSFPLAMLEAAFLGKPVLCFDRAGGAGEFVEDDCGFTVPHLDAAAMAEKAMVLLKSSELRERLGKNAEERVRQRHTFNVAGRSITDIISRTG